VIVRQSVNKNFGLGPKKEEVGWMTRALRDHLHANPGVSIRVDLDSQFVEALGVGRFPFDIGPSRKLRLKRGMDDCALALEKIDQIRAFATHYSAKCPWAFRKEPRE
jgi:3-isopropylmalate/(R)-2-methylmalate dehydratase small subunit